MSLDPNTNVDLPFVDPLAGPLDLRIFPTSEVRSAVAVVAILSLVLWVFLV